MTKQIFRSVSNKDKMENFKSPMVNLWDYFSIYIVKGMMFRDMGLSDWQTPIRATVRSKTSAAQ